MVLLDLDREECFDIFFFSTFISLDFFLIIFLLLLDFEIKELFDDFEFTELSELLDFEFPEFREFFDDFEFNELTELLAFIFPEFKETLEFDSNELTEPLFSEFNEISELLFLKSNELTELLLLEPNEPTESLFLESNELTEPILLEFNKLFELEIEDVFDVFFFTVLDSPDFFFRIFLFLELLDFKFDIDERVDNDVFFSFFCKEFSLATLLLVPLVVFDRIVNLDVDELGTESFIPLILSYMNLEVFEEDGDDNNKLFEEFEEDLIKFVLSFSNVIFEFSLL